MGTKTIYGMLVFLICGVFLFGTVSWAERVPTASKTQLLQATENAKKENREELTGIIRDIRTKKMDVSEESLPDFVSFLKEKDPQIQLLGAEGLYRLENAQSAPALKEYLKSRDIVGLEKAFDKGEISDQDGKWVAQGFSAAILALGEIGDESAIPLLESMRGASNLQFEFGGGPVEKALSQLGADGVRSLSNLGPDADSRKLMKAANAIRQIRDPDKVPALIATVNDANCNISLRGAAIQALGNIKEVDSLPFILAVLKQKENSRGLRITASIAAAESGQPQAEQALLDIIKEPQSDIYGRCLCALVSMDTDKYLPVLITSMLDKSIPLEQRKGMASAIASGSQEQLKPHIELIRKGLKAVGTDGKPEDKIRLNVWLALNKATGEEPPLEVSNPREIRDALSTYIRRKLEQEYYNTHNAGMGSNDTAKIELIVKQKTDSIIVQWHPENKEVKP